MKNWSLFPCDVLFEIALRMDTVEEFIIFSIVCRPWNVASSIAKPKWCSKFPWLLLPENTENKNEYSRNLFSLNTERCYQLKLPPTFGARCWGSSYGFIVVFDVNLDISIFNPLTQVQIFLPPQSTMPNQLELDISDYDPDKVSDREWLRSAFIRKAYVWKMKTNDDLIVIAIHGNIERKLAFARPGDQGWTSIITPDENGGVHDILCWDDQMLILYHNGVVGYCDIGEACSLQPLEAIGYLPTPFLHRYRRALKSLYMVDSFGDLLVILRYKEEVEDQNIFYETQTFKVYRLNFETKIWEKHKNLGDVALFVGDNCSTSIRASSSNNCKPNCIYFTDDEFQFWNQTGGHDMGVFDMNTKEIHTFYEGQDIHSNFCTSVWFTPNFS